MRRPVLAVLTAILLAVPLTAPASATSVTTSQPAGQAGSATASVDPRAAAAQTALVAAEDDRLSKVLAASAIARWSEPPVSSVFDLTTGQVRTLVLPAREQAYRLDDLVAAAPDAVSRTADGSYLVRRPLVVDVGATLTFEAGQRVRLSSGADGFVSVVSAGGLLRSEGTRQAPVSIISYDPSTGQPDQNTADGRAYLRADGGSVDLRNLTLTGLGFWSGRTGGLALTGAERTDPQSKRSATVEPGEQGAPPSVSLQESGDSSVTGHLENVSTRDNQFGLFISDGRGVSVRGGKFQSSRSSGLVVHRGSSDVQVSGVTVTKSGADGVDIARGATKVTVRDAWILDNLGSGVLLDGQPLADGPSAAGNPIAPSGGNVVERSRLTRNAHSGVRVIGGTDVRVSANTISGSDIGVLVTDAATGITVEGNTIERATRFAVALRTGAHAAVRTNTIRGGQTAIHLRDAVGEVHDNRISQVSQHALAAVGAVSGSVVTGNTLSGSGARAVDLDRATGLTIRDGANDTSGWQPKLTFVQRAERMISPATAIWIVLAVLLVLTAAKRGRRPIRHPYAAQAPLPVTEPGPDSAEKVRVPTG